MVRRLVFDPTDGQSFIGQRLRFDWSLLKHGFVCRYDDGAHLQGACRRLTELGYVVHQLDAGEWSGVADFYDNFAAALSLPAHFSRNLDGFKDALGSVAMFYHGSDAASTGTVVAIDNYQTLVDLDRSTAHQVLDTFARQASLGALLGHPMLCLVTTTDTELGPVGGRPVFSGSTWND